MQDWLAGRSPQQSGLLLGIQERAFSQGYFGGQKLFSELKSTNKNLHLLLASKGAIPQMKLCDFTDRKTLQECGVDSSSLMSPDLTVPQAWSAAVMAHPLQFDGIQFQSRFTNGLCRAIFDRKAGIKVFDGLGPISKLAEGDHMLNKFKIALV